MLSALLWNPANCPLYQARLRQPAEGLRFAVAVMSFPTPLAPGEEAMESPCSFQPHLAEHVLVPPPRDGLRDGRAGAAVQRQVERVHRLDELGPPTLLAEL